MLQDMENVVGDVVVAAGCVAYSGPFTPAFRQVLQQEWTALLKGASVPHTPDTNLTDTLQVTLVCLCSLPVHACSFLAKAWLADNNPIKTCVGT